LHHHPAGRGTMKENHSFYIKENYMTIPEIDLRLQIHSFFPPPSSRLSIPEGYCF